MMPSAASARLPCSAARGSSKLHAVSTSRAGRAEREGRGDRHHAARGRQRRFERNDDEPDRGERADAAGLDRDRGDEPGQRQRGQHMRALVLAGAREEIGDQDRRDQPGEDHHLERARHAAHDQIDRERGERGEAAKQARRDEGAMARRRQRVLLRRRMHQRVDIIANRREQSHVPLHVRLCRRAPLFYVRGSCQRPLKRTLRRRPRPRAGAAAAHRFAAVRRRHSRGMVNGRLPRIGAKFALRATRQRLRAQTRAPISASVNAA